MSLLDIERRIHSLRMKFVTFSNIVVHIQINIKDRMFHESTFNDHLVNKTTPYSVKLIVLHTGMFGACLESEEIAIIIALERKLLKFFIGFNQFGTPETKYHFNY